MKTKETTAATAVPVCETPGKARVRDRIFDTACELFYRQGIRAVGVDAIVCEAGTNKMSFYRSFPSKDELVAEYLRDSERKLWEWWDEVVAPYQDQPRRQAEALFDSLLTKPLRGDRGCAMANAAVEICEAEHPGLIVVRDHKTEVRRRFRKMAKEMGAHDPDLLGDSLTLLMHGAFSSRLIFICASGPASNAARAARTLIDAHMAKAQA
jgi:AcrR family transcriptional regulator